LAAPRPMSHTAWHWEAEIPLPDADVYG
jgi:hypothetical protein